MSFGTEGTALNTILYCLDGDLHAHVSGATQPPVLDIRMSVKDLNWHWKTNVILLINNFTSLTPVWTLPVVVLLMPRPLHVRRNQVKVLCYQHQIAMELIREMFSSGTPFKRKGLSFSECL